MRICVRIAPFSYNRLYLPLCSIKSLLVISNANFSPAGEIGLEESPSEAARVPHLLLGHKSAAY